MRSGPALARIFVAAGLLLAGIAAAPAAGALAIGACGAYGLAYDYARYNAAEGAAMRKCNGRGCRVVAAIRRNCAAFAIDGRNFCGAYGFSAASRLGPAQNSALRQCYRHGGKDCVIRAFVCDAKG
jgi:Domain of unknown function (DUF4189)